jgi:hypothetical protein
MHLAAKWYSELSNLLDGFEMTQVDNTIRLKQDIGDEVADTEAARQKRLQAIQLIAGLWAKRADAPKEGLAFQVAERSEW